uniref:Uncharacterized protein n=1 Tax=Romanomermis culicivorax TaxID=13658 RepID=A0A915I875_ROMCU
MENKEKQVVYSAIMCCSGASDCLLRGMLHTHHHPLNHNFRSIHMARLAQSDSAPALQAERRGFEFLTERYFSDAPAM